MPSISDLCLPSSGFSWMDRDSPKGSPRESPEHSPRDTQTNSIEDNQCEKPDPSLLKLYKSREYSKTYYHKHKQPAACDSCKKVYSSVSALNRHKKVNMHCQFL